MRLTPPLNLPALGRRQPPYVVYTTLRRPVFLVNSRLMLFSAATSGYKPYRGTPSPEVTGSICRVPERVFSQAPWNSLPTYLCRFAVRSPGRLTPEAFPGIWDQPLPAPEGAVASRLSFNERGIYRPISLYPCRTQAIMSLVYPGASPHVQTPAGGSGILTRSPSTTSFDLALGTDLP